MIFSFSRVYTLNNHSASDISYVIRQCVRTNTLLSLRDVSQFDTHNRYTFEANELPHFTFLSLLSNHFDTMSIDVNKEQVIIKLTTDFNKGIPF